jgi:galactokinase
VNKKALPKTTARFSPGRLEWLGNHTDYNNGTALAVAIDLGVTANVDTRNDDIIEITSENYPGEKITSRLQELSEKKYPGWSGYVLGVIALFRDAGYLRSGLQITISSTLPEGAGISSSAALECATALALRDLTTAPFSLLELAKLCQRAEHRYVGTQCGLLDQISSLAGKKNHALLIDFHDLSYRPIPLPQNCEFLVFPSGAKHTLVAGEYNERKASCEKAARLLGVPCLAQASPEQLQASTHLLDERTYRRALHVVGEIRRVRDAIHFLEKNSPHDVGRLMYESHESSVKNFENSHPALDSIVNWLRADGRVYGARLTGGGFGGSVLAFCEKNLSQSVMDDYITHAPDSPRPIRCAAGPGGWELAGLAI